MKLMVDLPSALESELVTEAGRLGLPLSEYALRLIATGRGVRPELHTGAELLRYWQGERLVGTRPEIADREAHARAVRAQAERRPTH